jgi:hypothetical protein
MYAAGVGLAAAAGVLLYTATRRRKDASTHEVASYEKYRRDGYRD